MKRSATIIAILVFGVLQSLYAQTPLPSTASFDVGFSPGGTALIVVEKAISAAHTEILMACYELCGAPHNSYYADADAMPLRRLPA